MRNRSNYSVDQLKDELKRLLKKKRGDDWEEAWNDMPSKVKTGCRKQPIQDEIDELDKETEPEYHDNVVKSELEFKASQADHRAAAVAFEGHTQRKRAEATEQQLEEMTEDRDKWRSGYAKLDTENRSLKRPFDQQAMVDALEREKNKNKTLEEKLGHSATMQTQFRVKCDENRKLQALVEAKSGPGADLLREKDKEIDKVKKEVDEVKKELGEVKEQNEQLTEQLTEQIAHKEALGPKPSDETDALKAKLARVEEQLADALLKNKVSEFMSEFFSEIMEIEKELKIYGAGGNEDFSKVFGLKAWHKDYNDETFSYVTLNARRILEKVLCDTMLYDRMQAFVGVDPDRRIHHKPRADQTERNAHTIEVCTRIWGKGFNDKSELIVIGSSN